jgi:hypothetical protein
MISVKKKTRWRRRVPAAERVGGWFFFVANIFRGLL